MQTQGIGEANSGTGYNEDPTVTVANIQCGQWLSAIYHIFGLVRTTYKLQSKKSAIIALLRFFQLMLNKLWLVPSTK